MRAQRSFLARARAAAASAALSLENTFQGSRSNNTSDDDDDVAVGQANRGRKEEGRRHQSKPLFIYTLQGAHGVILNRGCGNLPILSTFGHFVDFKSRFHFPQQPAETFTDSPSVQFRGGERMESAMHAMQGRAGRSFTFSPPLSSLSLYSSLSLSVSHHRCTAAETGAKQMRFDELAVASRSA